MNAEGLKEKLVSLYSEMMSILDTTEEIWPFCVQWGSEFPWEENKGILFVGKSINGGSSSSKDINLLFGDSEDRIFNRQEPLAWVDDNKGASYNPRRSAFWRLIRKVSSSYYHENWYNKIAWSNLYKFSPTKGNPNHDLQSKQKDICKKILEVEIETLKPRYVIFLTSYWENDFINHIKNEVSLTEEWGKYKTNGYLSNDCIYITSHHPQGKSSEKHKDAIVKIMNSLSI